MKDSPAFLTLDQVLAIHRRVIQAHGGDPTLRDPSRLESVVMMPAARFEGEFLHNGPAAMAAAYLFHLCKNHPFVDGNKRTALVSAEVFLLLNDRRLGATDDELVDLSFGVADGRISKEEAIAFFEQRVVSDDT